uniref:Uncharacterized protein n=1 Tax=Romanomermis culicivorax TaxID=13658 RepID=A0A915JM63_ROMCU
TPNSCILETCVLLSLKRRLLEKATEFSPLAPCQSFQRRLNRLERRRLFVEMLMRCLIFYCQIKDSSVDFAARYFVDAVDRLELLIAMIGKDQDVKFEEAPVLLEPVLKAFNDVDSCKYFGHPKPTWSEITPFLTIRETFSPNYFNETKNNGYFLCLYGFFMQQLPRCSQLHDETSILRELSPLFPIFKEKY